MGEDSLPHLLRHPGLVPGSTHPRRPDKRLSGSHCLLVGPGTGPG